MKVLNLINYFYIKFIKHLLKKIYILFGKILKIKLILKEFYD